MYWLLQNNFTDNAYINLKKNLKRLEIPHSCCQIIPFSNKFVEGYEPPKFDKPTEIFCFGSYSLIQISNPNWIIRKFNSPKLDMDFTVKNLGQDALNYDMEFDYLHSLNPKLDEFFIRPVADSKSFIARLRNKDDFKNWIDKLSKFNPDEFSTVTLNTYAGWCSPKPIEKEIRFIIINAKIVTYSQYKIGDQVIYSEVVDQYIIDFAQYIIDQYDNPEIAYVLDIAISNGEPKVIETNCINACGLYACDTQKFIMAIEDLVFI